MLALVDCNSCYASIESIFRPDLRGRPTVILSNNDGALIVKNAQAKLLDIPDFAPYFKVKDYLRANNVNVFSSNYELYGDISSRIMSLLSTFCVDMSVYSIDEAFLDLTGFKHLAKYGHQIKNEVWRQQRVPVCVGIGETQTLAKLANHLAKKSAKLNGVCFFENLNDWETVFNKVHVSKVWGVGSRITNRLALWDIKTVQDLRKQPPKRIRKEFGVTLERTVRELNGERCFALETQPPPKKEIISTRSFGKKVTTLHEIKQSVADHAMRVSEKLRKQDSLAGAVYVMLSTSRYAEERYHRSACIQLPYPTNDSRIIIENASLVAGKLFKSGYIYAKAGTGLIDLSTNKHQQKDLFHEGQSDGAFKLMSVIDTINGRFGKGQVFIGSQGTSQRWAMTRQFKSPAYTTRFSDIPIVKL